MALAPVLAALLVSAAPGPTAPTPEVRDQVRALLGSIHGPVPPETFRALGPGVEEALADFARGEEFPSRRIRALEALAGLGGDRAEAVHREVAADRTAPGSSRPRRRCGCCPSTGRRGCRRGRCGPPGSARSRS